MLKRTAVILRALFGRRRFEESLTDELRFHIEEYTDDLVRGGMPRDEAERRARIEFGGVETIREDCREARGLRLFDELQQDVRYGLRVLRKSPSFTGTAVATLAICLGANLTIFAVVDTILLRPLPFPAPDRLVRVYNTYPKADVPDDGASVTNYYERRGRIAAFSALALCRVGTAIVGDPGSVEREPVMRVTADFFSMLGVTPAVGRSFTEQELDPDSARVAILTDGFWRQRFDRDPAIVGRTVRVDGVERTVVGVLPSSFRFLSSKARLFLPLASAPSDRGPQNRHSGSSSQMIARLGPGVTIDAAQAELDAHSAAMEAGSPTAKMTADAGFRSLVMPLHAEHVAAVRPVLLFVQAGAICLLLVGGVNLVNLLLIRATARAREMAIRQAIGGGRARIVRQVIVETMLLSLAGGLPGIAFGVVGLRLLDSLGVATLPLGAQVAFDVRLAVLGVAFAGVVGLAMTIPVAWYSLRGSTQPVLSSESRASTSSRGVQRLRHGFLVAQVALAFALLFAAGLLALSLRRVESIAPGFRPANVLTGEISLTVRAYPDTAARRAFVSRLLTDLDGRPGIAASGIATNVPFSGRNIKSATAVAGYVPAPGESIRGHYARGVGGRYFEAMGFTLIEGRFLDPAEIQRGERVAVVDEDFARHYWPRASALGHRIFPGPNVGTAREAFTIVGVVSAAKQTGLIDRESTGTVFYPYSSVFDTELFVLARTTMAPERLASTLRDALRAIDPSLGIGNVQSMDTRIADSLVTRRSPAVLAAFFSAVALVLTAIGIYGVVGYAVAARRREIALRIALGATPGRMRRTFVSMSTRLVGAGSLLGLGAAWVAGRAMQAILYGVPPMHLPILVATGLLVAAISIGACLIPAVRAARVSPTELLS